jgi:hypothetical protein
VRFRKCFIPEAASAVTAAPDEVDYFEVVAVFEMSLRPAVAGDDVAVQFDGYAVRLHGEGFDQGCEGEVGGESWIGEGAGFSVDVKIHFIPPRQAENAPL